MAKNLRTFSILASVAALSLSFSACNSLSTGELEISEKNVTLTVDKEGTFTAVAPVGNTTDSDWSIYQGAAYTLLFNFTTNTCEIAVENLKYDSNVAAVSFTLSSIPLSSESNSTVRGVNYTGPMAFSDADGATHTIKNIRLYCLRDQSRVFSDETTATPTFQLSFTLDDTYKLRAMQYEDVFFGTTTSTNINNTEEVAEGTTAQYKVSFNMLSSSNDFVSANRTLDLTIANPRFIPAMPSTIKSMVFPNIPFKFTDNGFTFDLDALTPEIANTPYPAFPIRDLAGEVVSEKTFTLDFKCLSTNVKVGSWSVNVDATPYPLQ